MFTTGAKKANPDDQKQEKDFDGTSGLQSQLQHNIYNGQSISVSMSQINDQEKREE